MKIFHVREELLPGVVGGINFWSDNSFDFHAMVVSVLQVRILELFEIIWNIKQPCSFSLPKYLPSKHLLVFKTPWRRFQDLSQHVLKTSWKTKNCYAEDVRKTSWRHVLKTSWRHILKRSSRRLGGKKFFYWWYLYLTNLNVYLTNLCFTNFIWEI